MINSYLYSKESPCSISLKSRYLLSKSHSSKSTYHLVLDRKNKNLFFQPGDSIAIYPKNNLQRVENILGIFDLPRQTLIQDLRENKPISIGAFLAEKADLRATKKLLKTLLEQTDNIAYKKTLEELLARDKVALENYLLNTPIEKLFLSACLSPLHIETVCNSLPRILPRFYSIASSPLVYPEEIHLTVALAHYFIDEEVKKGLCSHFLCEHIPLGEEFFAYIQPTKEFLLPEDHSQDIIMIGPGTGIAPFISFLQHRHICKASGKNWLFFGERQKEHDFYYEDFLDSLIQEEVLILDTAFSRDQEKKVYVQHRIEEKASHLWEWIENGAKIYLCGDAKKMACDVEKSFLQLISFHKKVDELAAKKYLQQLRHEKRYLKDVY